MNDFAAGRFAARYIKALAATNNVMAAESFVAATNWSDASRVKAAVSAMSTGNASALTPVGWDFLAAVRPRTILGRLRERARRLPFYTQTMRQTAGTRATWVREGGPIAVTAGAFTKDGALVPRKVAGIAVVTEELARASDADQILTRDLENACIAALDEAFADPANAGVADERPASVFYGAPVVPSSGSDAAALRADLLALLDAYEGDLSSATLITSNKVAMQIGLMPAFAGSTVIDLVGDSRLAGLPLLASDSTPTDTSGSILGIVDLNRLEIGGLTEAEVTTSMEAAIQMNDTPTPGATTLVSLYQTDSVGILAKIITNWRAAPGAAAYIGGADYRG